MDNTMTLRDHSKPCEHGNTAGHYPHPEKPGFACPGGKEIVLRRTTLKDFTVKPDDVMYVEVSDV